MSVDEAAAWIVSGQAAAVSTVLETAIMAPGTSNLLVLEVSPSNASMAVTVRCADLDAAHMIVPAGASQVLASIALGAEIAYIGVPMGMASFSYRVPEPLTVHLTASVEGTEVAETLNSLDTLTLVASVMTEDSNTAELLEYSWWLVPGGSMPDGGLEGMLEALYSTISTHTPSVIVRAGALTAGEEYLFACTCLQRDDIGQITKAGEATITIAVNRAPSGGALLVASPSTVLLELTTEVSLAGVHLATDSNPLSYLFAYREQGSSLDIPLGPRQRSALLSTYLPAGQLTLTLTVYDVHLAPLLITSASVIVVDELLPRGEDDDNALEARRHLHSHSDGEAMQRLMQDIFQPALARQDVGLVLLFSKMWAEVSTAHASNVDPRSCNITDSTAISQLDIIAKGLGELDSQVAPSTAYLEQYACSVAELAADPALVSEWALAELLRQLTQTKLDTVITAYQSSGSNRLQLGEASSFLATSLSHLLIAADAACATQGNRNQLVMDELVVASQALGTAMVQPQSPGQAAVELPRDFITISAVRIHPRRSTHSSGTLMRVHDVMLRSQNTVLLANLTDDVPVTGLQDLNTIFDAVLYTFPAMWGGVEGNNVSVAVRGVNPLPPEAHDPRLSGDLAGVILQELNQAALPYTTEDAVSSKHLSFSRYDVNNNMETPGARLWNGTDWSQEEVVLATMANVCSACAAAYSTGDLADRILCNLYLCSGIAEEEQPASLLYVELANGMLPSSLVAPYSEAAGSLPPSPKAPGLPPPLPCPGAPLAESPAGVPPPPPTVEAGVPETKAEGMGTRGIVMAVIGSAVVAGVLLLLAFRKNGYLRNKLLSMALSPEEMLMTTNSIADLEPDDSQHWLSRFAQRSGASMEDEEELDDGVCDLVSAEAQPRSRFASLLNLAREQHGQEQEQGAIARQLLTVAQNRSTLEGTPVKGKGQGQPRGTIAEQLLTVAQNRITPEGTPVSSEGQGQPRGTIAQQLLTVAQNRSTPQVSSKQGSKDSSLESESPQIDLGREKQAAEDVGTYYLRQLQGAFNKMLTMARGDATLMDVPNPLRMMQDGDAGLVAAPGHQHAEELDALTDLGEAFFPSYSREQAVAHTLLARSHSFADTDDAAGEVVPSGALRTNPLLGLEELKGFEEQLLGLEEEEHAGQKSPPSAPQVPVVSERLQQILEIHQLEDMQGAVPEWTPKLPQRSRRKESFSREPEPQLTPSTNTRTHQLDDDEPPEWTYLRTPQRGGKTTLSADGMTSPGAATTESTASGTSSRSNRTKDQGGFHYAEFFNPLKGLDDQSINKLRMLEQSGWVNRELGDEPKTLDQLLVDDISEAGSQSSGGGRISSFSGIGAPRASVSPSLSQASLQKSPEHSPERLSSVSISPIPSQAGLVRQRSLSPPMASELWPETYSADEETPRNIEHFEDHERTNIHNFGAGVINPVALLDIQDLAVMLGETGSEEDLEIPVED